MASVQRGPHLDVRQPCRACQHCPYRSHLTRSAHFYKPYSLADLHRHKDLALICRSQSLSAEGPAGPSQQVSAAQEPPLNEGLPAWERLLKLLTVAWHSCLLFLRGVLEKVTPPKPASMAEAREEAQKKGQGQRKLGANISSKEYKMALARTRQHVSIQKALQLQRQGSPARAEVELQRALHENAVCRAPLLAANYTKQQMQGLYRLHMENTELPPNFAQLLQLRDMLGLDAQEAEQLEADIMSNAAQFSI